jgi:integrase
MEKHELYNEEVKEDFLSQKHFSEGTRVVYRRIFEKSRANEEVLNKDLYDFTRQEIEEVLHDLNPLTPPISQSNGRVISSYIIWWIDKNKLNKINPLEAVGAEWFDRFVDKTKKLYFSYKEIKRIVDLCENAQDAVILLSYFEDIGGKDGSEIRNLKITDLDEDLNTVILREKGKTPRVHVISDELKKLIISASKQKTYIKKDGKMIEIDNIRPDIDLVENEYVVRNSLTRTDSLNSPVHSSVIYRRMKTLSESFGFPYLTGKNVLRSGIIYFAWKLLQQEGALGKEQYEKIAEKFRLKNWYTLKDFCNYETIEKLYGEVAATISA